MNMVAAEGRPDHQPSQYFDSVAGKLFHGLVTVLDGHALNMNSTLSWSWTAWKLSEQSHRSVYIREEKHVPRAIVALDGATFFCKCTESQYATCQGERYRSQ